MEGLTRLVSESFARHGFDRPLDYRRLHWSRWFRCESHHSLLFVPSKPGVFAVAEEIMDLDHCSCSDSRLRLSREPKRAAPFLQPNPAACSPSPSSSKTTTWPSSSTACSRTQNPMRARLASGRYFVRFVVIEDQTQRRSICSALNQWMVTAAEKATGIGSHFATSLELTSATEYIPQPDDRQQPLFAGDTGTGVATAASAVPQTLSEAKGCGPCPETGFSASAPATPHLHSGAATNIQPSPFPSGF